MKTNVLKMIFISVIFLLLSTKCKKVTMDVRYPLHLINNSTHSIRYYISTGYNNTPVYPDTSLPIVNNFVDVIPPGNNFIIYDSGAKSSELYEKFLPADTLSVFIFHADTINLLGWETVRNEYKILKRYDLSLSNLEQLNYKLYYPTNNAMQDIKMFP